MALLQLEIKSNLPPFAARQPDTTSSLVSPSSDNRRRPFAPAGLLSPLAQSILHTRYAPLFTHLLALHSTTSSKDSNDAFEHPLRDTHPPVQQNHHNRLRDATRRPRPPGLRRHRCRLGRVRLHGLDARHEPRPPRHGWLPAQAHKVRQGRRQLRRRLRCRLRPVRLLKAQRDALLQPDRWRVLLHGRLRQLVRRGLLLHKQPRQEELVLSRQHEPRAMRDQVWRHQRPPAGQAVFDVDPARPFFDVVCHPYLDPEPAHDHHDHHDLGEAYCQGSSQLDHILDQHDA